jgi:hypothetical protein
MNMDHNWSDGEMERAIDICLEHSPGAARTTAGERLSGAVNNRTPRNPVTPSAMAAALEAAASAIDGVPPLRWKPAKRLLELIEARRVRGTLTKSW